MGGGALYFRLDKEVTLVVDGEAAQVRTFSWTVGDLLEGQGVEVGPHDEVSPPVSARLADGMRVRVLHAKEITVVLNGMAQTVYVTGSTVGDVLEHINVRAKRGDHIQPSRKAPIEGGDVVVFREAVEVRLSVDGQSRSVITNASTVGNLLDSLAVVVRQHDLVVPAAETALHAGMRIKVVRVEIRRVAEQTAIGFRTEVRYSDELLRGQQRVEREGVTGLREAAYRVRIENGREVNRKLLEERVVREPVNRIVVVGTRDPNVQEGLASWYDWDGQVGACRQPLSGMYAAHRTLPCGTVVRVTNLANGRSVSVVIKDRGPYVGGRIIDLNDEAYRQIAPLGSGTVRVRITW